MNVIKTIEASKCDKELVLCMDHNMNLLKSHQHEPMRGFIDGLLEMNIFPTIT